METPIISAFFKQFFVYNIYVKESLGIFIAQCRKARGLSQAELAEKVFMSPQAISSIEKNSSSLSLDTAKRIAEALGIGLNDLYSREMPKKAKTPAKDLDEKQIAGNLQNAREKSGMSRMDVANAMGISERTVRNYENGQRTPSFQYVESLTELTHNDFNSFFVTAKSRPHIPLSRVLILVGAGAIAVGGGGAGIYFAVKPKMTPVPSNEPSSLYSDALVSSDPIENNESLPSQEEPTSEAASSESSWGLWEYSASSTSEESELRWSGRVILRLPNGKPYAKADRYFYSFPCQFNEGANLEGASCQIHPQLDLPEGTVDLWWENVAEYEKNKPEDDYLIWEPGDCENGHTWIRWVEGYTGGRYFFVREDMTIEFGFVYASWL